MHSTRAELLVERAAPRSRVLAANPTKRHLDEMTIVGVTGTAPEGVGDLWGSTGEGQIRNGLGNGTCNALLNAGFLDPRSQPPSEALQAVLSGYSTNVSSWIGNS